MSEDLSTKLDRLQRYRINARKANRALNRSLAIHQQIYRKEIALTHELRQQLNALKKENALLKAQLTPSSPDITGLARAAFWAAREEHQLRPNRVPKWKSFEQWWEYCGSRFFC